MNIHAGEAGVQGDGEHSDEFFLRLWLSETEKYYVHRAHDLILNISQCGNRLASHAGGQRSSHSGRSASPGFRSETLNARA